MSKPRKTILIPTSEHLEEGQCHFYVLRKKRFCRMTVKPGRNYCGEHEPQPKVEDGQDDRRITCPLDSKHTCYASKLEKHLTICNARGGDTPPYLIQNVNAPSPVKETPRIPLSEISREAVQRVVQKINKLYDLHIRDHITTTPTQPIHDSVLPEFNEDSRTERSLRHLRQASSILHIAEVSGLVQDETCYVELGAGKGQLSYYLGVSWCHNRSRVLSIDRASMRHKRDNRLRSEKKPADVTHSRTFQNVPDSSQEVLEGSNLRNVKSDIEDNGREVAVRLRADLAHLALEKVPVVEECQRVVGFAKHLCGVATDYALRCLTADGVLHKCSGGVLATCCHHRCERGHFVADTHLQNLGISGEEFNVMLGIVSWATCGDGLSREVRNFNNEENDGRIENRNIDIDLNQNDSAGNMAENLKNRHYREQVGRKAKLIIDWGRILYLKEKGFNARLCYFVDTSVSLENVCIVATIE